MRDEPGVCLSAIYLASEPEERDIEHDGGEQKRLKFEDFVVDSS